MPKLKSRDYQLTAELLQQYQGAALVNARELLTEATLLLEHNHYARAYFLAVASIEEIGKAVQAFQGMGRNLKDSAVCTRLKLQFDDHSQKLTAAFLPWILATPNLRGEITTFANLIVDVGHGREPSMYTDIRSDGLKVTTPTSVVRSKASEDCVRLAHDVLSHARSYLTQMKPKVTTHAEDALFALKPSVLQKMAKTEDFWWYYVSRMEAGDKAFEAAVTNYYKKYFLKDIKFKENAG